MKLEDQLCFLSRATKDIAFDAQQEMARLDKVVTTAKQAADVASKMRLLVKAVKAAVDSFEEHRHPHISDTYLAECMIELSNMYNAVMAEQPEMHIVDLGAGPYTCTSESTDRIAWGFDACARVEKK